MISVDVTGVIPVGQRGLAGGLAGANAGTITDSYATGSVTANSSSIGGLVGSNGGAITGSHAAVNVALSVTGNQGSTPDRIPIHMAGGLAGDNSGSTTDSYATGNVTGNVVDGYGTFGGLAGGMCDGVITNSYATGNVAVEATGRSSGNVGGLVGASVSSNITNSYATGGLAGSGSNASTDVQDYITTNLVEDDAGGFITASYAGSREPGQGDTGGVPNRVTGSGNTGVGGLVGLTTTCARDDAELPESTATDSYWDTQTSGQSSSAGGIGKTTRELQSPTSNTGIYANWDPAVWDFGTSSQYPALKSGAGTTTPPALSGDCVEDIGTLTETGVERTGNWTTDCPSTTEANAYARFYSFTLDQDSDVSVHLTSTDQNNTANLLVGAGSDGPSWGAYPSLREIRESGPRSSPFSVTFINVPAGTYTLETIAENAGPGRTFALTVRRWPPSGTGTPSTAAKIYWTDPAEDKIRRANLGRLPG